MKTKPLVLIAVLAAAALAGCGGGDDTVEPGGDGTTPPAAATGPGLSIEEALASDLEGALLVNGNLLAEGGEVRLCSALAESFPPQCGGPSLVVHGLDYTAVEGVVTVEGVSWSDRPIQVLGVVADGTITVSENAKA